MWKFVKCSFILDYLFWKNMCVRCASFHSGTCIALRLAHMRVKRLCAPHCALRIDDTGESHYLNLALFMMQVLNEEIFAILVLMALFTTFITTPTVMAIYKPARCHHHPINHRKLQGSSTTSSPPAAIDSKELRILACVHSQRNIPSIINLIDTVRGGGTKKLTTLKLYIMHLVELTERSSSIVLVRRFRRNGLPFRNPLKRNGGRSVAASMIDVAFEAYGQLSKVRVRPMTAVSAMASMHEDVCNIAEEKKVILFVFKLDMD